MIIKGEEKMRKPKKSVKILLILLAVVALLAAVGAVFISMTSEKLEALSGTRIDDVDLSAVPDGAYEGQYSAFPVSAKVRVTIMGNQMTGIDLIEHVNGQGRRLKPFRKPFSKLNLSRSMWFQARHSAARSYCWRSRTRYRVPRGSDDGGKKG